MYACRRIYAPVKDHERVKPLVDLAGRGVSQCNKDALLKLSAHGYDLLGHGRGYNTILYFDLRVFPTTRQRQPARRKNSEVAA